MNKITLIALITVSFTMLHADTPSSDSFAYKVMRVEDFIQCHSHFFNIVKYSAEIGVSAFALHGIHRFHCKDMLAYMQNEQNFNEQAYAAESRKLEPSRLFMWVGQSRANTEGKVEGIKVPIQSPCYAPAAICIYLIARGSYGICKELYSFAQECLKKKPVQK